MKERAINTVSMQRQHKINLAKAKAQSKLAEALAIPEIANAHAEYVNLIFKSYTQKVSEKDIEKAQKNYQKTLKMHGFFEADFEYSPVCPICKDTGNDNGKVCKCVWDEYIKALKAECKIQEKAQFTFDDCNIDSLSNVEQKNELASIYNFMKQYSSKLPDVKLKNIVLSGNTGTGKTCLASAVARNAVEHGKSCKFMSAFEFNSEMLSTHTSPVAERNQRLHDVLTADLLVIDDLGVEPMYKNVTAEYLLLVIEERTRAGLCTIFTTNLSEHDVQTKYGDRICSRMLDKRHSRFVILSGNDLRLN